jgi:hypothetical protein
MVKMQPGVGLAIGLIVAHLAVNIFHGLAHQRLAIEISPAEKVFVVVVILIAPLLAGVLLLLKTQRKGAWLLVISMAGALIFGIYKHFIAPGPDHAFGLPYSAWALVFQVTAVLLVVTEATGCWAGIRILTQENS